MEYLVLPNTIAIGDFIEFVQRKMTDESGRRIRYTFSGSVYFNRMKEEGLYEINSEFIQQNIEKAGLKDIYYKCLV